MAAGYYLVSLASLHFIVIPRSDDPGIYYFVVAILWMMVLSLAITTVINLWHGSLLVIPTVVQCVALALTLFLLPFAIWGGFLLRQRIQCAQTAEESSPR